MQSKTPKILLTGTTGFVGGRLLRALLERGFSLRCMVRSTERFLKIFPSFDRARLVEADLLRPGSLDRALEGIELIYYLVHSMGGHSLHDAIRFAERDRQAAINLTRAAERAGVRRVIYLGGLGELADNLSKHLASRQEVARILESGAFKVTLLRAANIIGAGGAPFEMLRHLVERFPILFAPRWIDTRCQPIDINDAVAYLTGCMEKPETAGEEFDIGGPKIITYRQMMKIYASVRGLKRLIVSTPFLTPGLSSIWISMFTPVPSGVTFPLLEGLKNEVICRENRIREIIPLSLTPLEVSICNALQETNEGPGKLRPGQSCFLRNAD
jgi:uncharacterized protein YbjT (DUF2867 family)